MFTIREIMRFGLRYYGVFYHKQLFATAMSEVGALQCKNRLERKLAELRRDTLPL